MPNFKITQLPSASQVEDTDVFPIVDVSETETKHSTVALLKDHIASTITEMPSLIVDPVTNFTDFEGSVRNQFSQGTNITISDGVISSTAASNITSVEASGNIDVANSIGPNPTVSLKEDISLTSVTASFNGDGSQLTNIPTGALQANGITIGSTLFGLGLTGSQIQGLSSVSSSGFTGSFNGDGSQLTNLSASQFNQPNFTNDIRSLFSGLGTISYNSSTGQFSSSGGGASGTITSVIAGDNLNGGGTSGDITVNLDTILTGLTSVSSSQISASNFTGSLATFSVLSASNVQLTGNLNGTASIASQVANSVTFRTSSADAAPVSYNGSTARTISFNTVGAPSVSGTNATGSWTINIAGSSSLATTASNSTLTTANPVVHNLILADGATGTRPLKTDSELTYNASTNALIITGSLTGTVGVSGALGIFNNISASTVTGTVFTGSFRGNGSQLTNLTASSITGFQNDVRSQFSVGPGVSITSGKISSLMTAGSNMSIPAPADGVAYTIGLSNSISGLTSVSSSQISASFYTGSSVTASVGRFNSVTSSAVSASNFTGSTATLQTLSINGNTFVGDNSSDQITFTAGIANIGTSLNFASNLLVLDNSNNNVAINGPSPGSATSGSTLTLNGSFAGKVSIYTTPTGSVKHDDFFIMAAGTNITELQLPPLSTLTQGRIYTFTSVASKPVAITPTGSINLMGAVAPPIQLANSPGKYASVQLMCVITPGGAGSGWYIVSRILN